MRKTATVLLAVGVLLGSAACGSTKPEVYVNQAVYKECWSKHWPTYRKNITDGMLGRAEGQAKLDRMCRAAAQKPKESK